MPNSKAIGQQVKNSNLQIDVRPTKQAVKSIMQRIAAATGVYEKARKQFAVSKTLSIFAVPKCSNTTAKYIDYYAIIRRTSARLFFGIAALWRVKGVRSLYTYINQIVFRKMPKCKAIGQQVKNSNLQIDVRPTKQAVSQKKPREYLVYLGIVAILMTSMSTEAIGLGWTMLGLILSGGLIYIGHGFSFQQKHT